MALAKQNQMPLSTSGGVKTAEGTLINPRAALVALDRHLQDRMQWMLRATVLMQMIDGAGVDHAKLRRLCEEHIQAMPEV